MAQTPETEDRDRGGRPSKFDARKAEQILSLVTAGNFLETAAAAVGVSAKTVRNWLRKAQEGGRGSKPFREFADRFERAQAEAEVLLLHRLGEQGATDWRATAWRLERRFPERYGQHQAVELSAPGGKPIASGVIIMPPLNDDGGAGGTHDPTAEDDASPAA